MVGGMSESEAGERPSMSMSGLPQAGPPEPPLEGERPPLGDAAADRVQLSVEEFAVTKGRSRVSLHRSTRERQATPAEVDDGYELGVVPIEGWRVTVPVPVELERELAWISRQQDPEAPAVSSMLFVPGEDDHTRAARIAGELAAALEEYSAAVSVAQHGLWGALEMARLEVARLMRAEEIGADAVAARLAEMAGSSEDGAGSGGE
jgi:hypothetical protein